MKKNNPLLKIVYENEENLLDQVRTLLQAGSDPNECTEYFETPLRVSSRLGRFDVVKLLIEFGADSSHLNWAPLFHAIAYGNLLEVKDCVEDGTDLCARDIWERTPFLLAIQSGDIDKVSYLINAGVDIAAKGRCDKPALEYAIQMDNSNMLIFLIQKGFDCEAYNSFGYTPLMQAAEDGAINCIRVLLEQCVNIFKKDRSQFSQKTAIAHATTLEIALILAEAGDDLNQLEGIVRANLLNLGIQKELTINKKEYLEQKYRVYGVSNPQKCKLPFWYDMVRCNASAWKARSWFDDNDDFSGQPVWCYERFGKSITSIGGGEFIEIAGEHEDHYDPDFCIYNDVFHHKGKGILTIYQYPKDIFPPTDFHTATLVNGYIYIIGNLGYPEKRNHGVTPVYRLDIETFEIEKIESSGKCPGWIYNHSASLSGPSKIRVQGGEIIEKTADREEYQSNKFDFELDLETLEWTRYEHIPKSGVQSFFPEEYKRFRHSDGTIVAVENENKWQLLKVISVYRIDVVEGQYIKFESETQKPSSDDFLFVVAYSISKPFDTFKRLEKAVSEKDWNFENKCNVCRTTMFPEYSQYIGLGEITGEECESFRAWKISFERGEAKIA